MGRVILALLVDSAAEERLREIGTEIQSGKHDNFFAAYNAANGGRPGSPPAETLLPLAELCASCTVVDASARPSTGLATMRGGGTHVHRFRTSRRAPR